MILSSQARASVFALLLALCMTFANSRAQPAKSDVDCAEVVVIKCSYGGTRIRSAGFSIRNECGRGLQYHYESHHKDNGKTNGPLGGLAPANQTHKLCGVSATSDVRFLTFLGMAQRKQMDRVRKLNEQLGHPEEDNPSVTRQMIDVALNLASVSDAADLGDYTRNVNRAFWDLKDIRNEKPSNAQSIPLRNAEYYVMGLYAGLSHDDYLSPRIDFSDAYMALKWAARSNKYTEYLVRSDKSIPSSPPGGTEWAKGGLLDGRLARDGWTTAPDAKLRLRHYPD